MKAAEAPDTDHPEVNVSTLETDPVVEEDIAGSGDAPVVTSSSRRRRSVTFSVRGLATAAIVVALVSAVAAMSWLYFDARHQLDVQSARSGNDARAEKIALDYAVSAASMDYRDLPGWQVKLVAGTSQELNSKLTEAGKSMEQVLVPLKWSSTAQPLAAKVRSSTGGLYVVDSFVSVQTKTVQAPEALQSTATYSTTIDSNNNWQITDVGGIGSAMGPK
jgi:hypothetical protein